MSVSSLNFGIRGSELTPQICVLTRISGAFRPGNTRKVMENIYAAMVAKSLACSIR